MNNILINCELQPTKQETSPLSFATNDLEHTELLADVGKTLGLLGLVVDDVESHSLGKRSIHQNLHIQGLSYLHCPMVTISPSFTSKQGEQ